MRSLCAMLFAAAIGFCIAGVMGHPAAWPAAALSIFAAAMIIVRQRKKESCKADESRFAGTGGNEK